MKRSARREAVENLRSHYRSGEHNLSNDFFIPCLSKCSAYKRAVGFFSSSSLVSWARALPRVIATDDLEIKLLISPRLSEDDREALRHVTSDDKRHELLQELGDSILHDALDFAEDPSNREQRVRLFLWLLATGRMKLLFAFPTHTADPGIYHEKMGVFEFPWGARVAFSGSANETISGHNFNYESIDVFRSWVPGDVERVEQKTLQFDRLWNGSEQGVTVVSPSANVLDRLRTIAPQERPGASDDPDSEEDDRWRHQDRAIETFLQHERGVLEMATGTGKTRTALRIAKRLVSSGRITSIIIATYGTDLLRQWEKKLLALTQELPRPFTLHRHFHKHHERDLFRLQPEDSVLLSSRKALAPALRELDEKEGRRTLLIHDEVHGLGSPANRSELQGLSSKIRYRLGLSATPEREYDAEGTKFIEDHVGPVIFEFTLGDAIRRGILSPFDYHPLYYEPSEEDRERTAQVFKRKAAREAEGKPMTDEELWIQLARVHKTSEAKLPVFEAFIEDRSDLLARCIIFVETREYGKKVLEIVHRHRHDFHTYFSADDDDVLGRFAAGDLECLLTCHRLSEGIDIRNLRTVILFSSARSRLETIQRIGRSLRRDPENPAKKAQVVDFIRTEESDEKNPDQQRAEWLAEESEALPDEWGDQR